MDQDKGQGAPYLALDHDGRLKTAPDDAPPHMHILYDLIKSAHDSNAAALTELKSSHAANAAMLAENSRVLADTTRALNDLAARVHEVEQSQQSLSTRVDSTLTEIRANVSHNTAANQEQRTHHTLTDTRQLIVRGIPPAVRHEPLALSAALLTALKLELYIQLVVGWRVWNPPARTERPAQAASTAPAALVPAAPLRALVFTLASAETRDDILLKTPALKDIDCQVIFGAGGPAKLSVGALWPDPVHNLLKHATACHKQLGHLRPVVKNLTVCLRPTKNGPLLLVTCEADIDALVPAES